MGYRVFTINLDEKEYERLDRLARQTKRSKAFFVKEALKRYLDDVEEVFLLQRSMERLAFGEEELVPFEEVKKRLEERKKACMK